MDCLTQSEAWAAVAMATAGALLVWIDTGKPNMLLVPLALLFLLGSVEDDA